jgi:hypothetical protein
MKTKNCLNCNTTFKKTPSMGNPYWKQRILCGRNCQSEWMKGKHNSINTEWGRNTKYIKSCTVCQTEFTAFALNAKYCSNECYKKEKQRLVKLRPNYKINARKSALKQKFNLTLEEYEKMRENQNNMCAICGIHQDKVSRWFAVDHNHITGQIRGLLCLECNNGIGKLKDSVINLKKAINYLEQDFKMRKAGKL